MSLNYFFLLKIKLLIPNTTAGLLIGKAGAYIKLIKDESGAFVQISSKQTDLPERIVIIEGEPDKRNKALQMVIRKIADDPQHNSVTNLNYSSISNGVDSYGNNLTNQNGHNQSNNQNAKFDFNSAAHYLGLVLFKQKFKNFTYLIRAFLKNI